MRGEDENGEEEQNSNSGDEHVGMFQQGGDPDVENLL